MELNLKYIDPSYAIRSVPANPHDSVYCIRLAHNAVHAAMSGRTEMVVGRWHGRFVHVPMPLAIRERYTRRSRRRPVDVACWNRPASRGCLNSRRGTRGQAPRGDANSAAESSGRSEPVPFFNRPLSRRSRFLGHELEVGLIELHRFSRIEVEEGPAVGGPTGAIVVEHGSGGPEVADVLVLFHAASLDGLEADRQGDQRGELAAATIAAIRHLVGEVAIGPAEAARFAARLGPLHEAPSSGSRTRWKSRRARAKSRSRRACRIGRQTTTSAAVRAPATAAAIHQYVFMA